MSSFLTEPISEAAGSSRDDLLEKWKSLVNMSAAEIEAFLGSEEGGRAGISEKQQSEAREAGSSLRRGRDSGRAIVAMKKKDPSEWTDAEWEWAKRQVSFISRMRGAKGPLRKDGKKTRKLLSLLVWGHDPEKAR